MRTRCADKVNQSIAWGSGLRRQPPTFINTDLEARLNLWKPRSHIDNPLYISETPSRRRGRRRIVCRVS